MTATMTNGHVDEARVREVWQPGMTARQLAGAASIRSTRTAGYWCKKLSDEQKGGEAAPGPSHVAPVRVRTPRKTDERHWVDTAVIWLVGLTVGLWSFTHIVDLAIMAGLGWRSWLAPVALDGLAIVAIRNHARHRIVATIGIVVGIVGSVAANAIAVRPEMVDLADVAVVLAAYGPIALAVIVHLVRR